jgi:hypothetical protein
MSTDPDEIRARIAALLAELPGAETADADIDIDVVATRLEEAHELLVQALESVEKGPAGWSVGGTSRPEGRGTTPGIER